eukprot:gnl/TRDRNA2_/TRDRNA2_176695_c0_seq1.p1 gnl/TRDRNA2_/TRDRNA2_176695_c0~~gnl/TRDRNA2_/TRDRNA2_176695_c0_seq1.p1  ORF type:complete len:534 (-),score=10.61 gnl/TRDRNA2_/TRDRNA2_176695_c0_seq1:138-1553(-)
MGGPVIDDKKQIYLTIMTEIIKFSTDGAVIWQWKKPGKPACYLMDTPAIMDGLIYTVDTCGTVFAVGMENGQLRWSKSHAESVDSDNGFVVARDGRVILEVDPHGPSEPRTGKGLRLNRVICLNGTDGSLSWEFKPDVGVWNFLPLFPMDGEKPDGTIVFQSWIGSVYRVNLTNGEQLWRSGPLPETGFFTDGGAAIGENGMMYAVTSREPTGRLQGGLHAFNVSNGKLMWEHTNLEAGLWTWPVVARLAENAPLSVVTGVGMLAAQPRQMIYENAVLKVFVIRRGAIIGLLLGLCSTLWRRYMKHQEDKPLHVALRLLFWILFGIAFWLLIFVPTRIWLFVPTTLPYAIHAYDANTGARQWRVELPTYYGPSAAGDSECYRIRNRMQPWRPIALPCASSYPTVDAQGIAYLAHMDGYIYKIKDWNHDGIIDQETELCRFHAGGAGFTVGPSMAPGMMAVATTDALYVFGE